MVNCEPAVLYDDTSCMVGKGVKVSFLQNEFMKSPFLPKYEQKIVRTSALCSEGRNPDNFCPYFGRRDDFIDSF